jgi:hypothetical protein
MTGFLFEPERSRGTGIVRELREFAAFGTATREERAGRVPVLVNEFWTSAQRAAHRLHEVSYRACFKPQLPRFFVERLTKPGGRVYDPFLGRGTTPVEAALLGRKVAGCDVNPLSKVLCAPRLAPPPAAEVRARLAEIPFDVRVEAPLDLRAFYHEDTLREVAALRAYLLGKGPLDPVDAWIQMVATNRLTGHSPGFFSVYTLPPNQATGVEAQRKINEKRGQVPPRRDVREIVAKKSDQLLKGLSPAERKALRASDPVLLTGPANATPEIASASVDLVVTSPPFLDVVQYRVDNWLRCWFCGIDPDGVAITMARTVEGWAAAMGEVFAELWRVVKPGGHVAFEVGEVRGGKVRLEEVVLPVATKAGFAPLCVQVNAQDFTKTAMCWGIANNAKGTNTNRIVLLRR